jgi:hypothetical protein
MKAHRDVHDGRAQVRQVASSYQRSGSLLELAAINLAWPLGLIRFLQGLMAEQSSEVLQGLLFFLAVFFYVLVRLYQLRRMD